MHIIQTTWSRSIDHALISSSMLYVRSFVHGPILISNFERKKKHKIFYSFSSLDVGYTIERCAYACFCFHRKCIANIVLLWLFLFSCLFCFFVQTTYMQLFGCVCVRDSFSLCVCVCGAWRAVCRIFLFLASYSNLHIMEYGNFILAYFLPLLLLLLSCRLPFAVPFEQPFYILWKHSQEYMQLFLPGRPESLSFAMNSNNNNNSDVVIVKTHTPVRIMYTLHFLNKTGASVRLHNATQTIHKNTG